MKMCLMSLISTCRREKYLARTRINTNFIISTGWKENRPRLNQLLEPLEMEPQTTSVNKITHIVVNKNINTLVRFKKRKSMKEKIKKTARDSATQIIRRLKKPPPPSSAATDSIVTSPPA